MKCASLVTASLAVLTHSIAVVQAGFVNTHALSAWADDDAANLDSLRPYAAKASQAHQLALAASKGEECFNALFIEVPSFSHDDLAVLPAMNSDMQAAKVSLSLPYLQGPSVQNLRKMVERRFERCHDSHQIAFLRAPKHEKSGQQTRMQWLAKLDTILEKQLDALPSPRIVVLTSVPDVGSHYREKRQIPPGNWGDILNKEFGQLDDFLHAHADHAPDMNEDQLKNSVFAPGYSLGQNGSNVEGGSLLDRYTFTSPYLIVGTLILLLIVLPAVLMAINALTSIELVKGLEQGKMQGGQSMGESKKDQ